MYNYDTTDTTNILNECKSRIYAKFSSQERPHYQYRMSLLHIISVILALLASVQGSSLTITCLTPSLSLLQGQITSQVCELAWNGCSSNAQYGLSITTPPGVSSVLSRTSLTPSVNVIGLRVNVGAQVTSGVYTPTLQVSGSGCDNVLVSALSLSVYCSSPVGCATCLDASTCVSCQPGFYLNGLTCSQCPANTYSGLGATECSPCPDGSTSSEGASYCTVPCVDWLNVPTNCQSCPDGATLRSDLTDDCPGTAGWYPMTATGPTNYQASPLGVGVVTGLTPRYFEINGLPVASQVPLTGMTCSSGAVFNWYTYPMYAGVYMQARPSLLTDGNAYTVSAWLHLNTGIAQLSWSTLTQVGQFPYYFVIPDVGSPLTCLFTNDNTTCHLYNSDVVLPPLPVSEDVYFALTESNIANGTGTCDNWGVYYNSVLQTPISCAPNTRSSSPQSEYVVFSFTPGQDLWDGVVSALSFAARVLTPNELYLLSTCQATIWEAAGVTVPAPALCHQADQKCVTTQ